MPVLPIVFMGTAEIACPSLEALARAPGYQILAVVSQPDRPGGRDLKKRPPAVKVAAVRLGLPVLQPEQARHPEFIEELRQLHPELIVVAAYGQLLPRSILSLPRHACLNVHTSLLPKHRGAAPIQWAILEGDPETGVTIMKMDAGLDTGEIISQRSVPVFPGETALTLHERLGRLGAELLLETIPAYLSGALPPRPQPAEGISYARKLTKEDGRLNWKEPAEALERRIRALNPWPGAYSWLPQRFPRPLVRIWAATPEPTINGAPGEILEAGGGELVVGCGRGALRIQSLQREGARRLGAPEFLAGCPLDTGEALRSHPEDCSCP